MSQNKHPYDDFEKELEDLIENLFPKTADEEDFGYFSPNSPRKHPVSSDDLDYERDTPPPIPEEAKCKHERWKKVDMTYSSFYVCKNCKADLGNKAPDDKQKN